MSASQIYNMDHNVVFDIERSIHTQTHSHTQTKTYSKMLNKAKIKYDKCHVLLWGTPYSSAEDVGGRQDY